MTDGNKEIALHLIPGIYSAIGQFKKSTLKHIDPTKHYACAVSVGWNPTYDNAEKTCRSFIDDDNSEMNILCNISRFEETKKSILLIRVE